MRPAEGSDEETVEIRMGGRQVGKTAVLNRAIEKALDAGITVHNGGTGETRGAGVAKDVSKLKRMTFRQVPFYVDPSEGGVPTMPTEYTKCPCCALDAFQPNYGCRVCDYLVAEIENEQK